jgi:hypothetical protein
MFLRPHYAPAPSTGHDLTPTLALIRVAFCVAPSHAQFKRATTVTSLANLRRLTTYMTNPS